MTALQETFYNRSPELPNELLRGAIDSHVHAGPVLTSNPSYPDPFQIAEEARDAGMRAVVDYDVFGMSSGTAWLVGRRVEGISVFGGLILSSCQGGLNPRAVLTALYYGAGARFVSFGAHCTHFQASQEARLVGGNLVPLKDLYPEFAAQELSRAIRIPLDDSIPPELDSILREVGPEHFVLCTDYGVRAAPSAVQGMRTLIATLLDMEFTPDEIPTMTSRNPARLLGLE